MKVFITWSGPLSKQIALAMHEWLPSMIQSVTPFMSSEDIRKGARGGLEIANQLEATSFGIVCLTKANLTAPWVHFEAGAIARSVKSSHLAVLLVDVTLQDVPAPLRPFQAAAVSDDGEMLKLIKDLNHAAGSPVDVSRLQRQFEKYWPDLEEQVATALREYLGAQPQQPRPRRRKRYWSGSSPLSPKLNAASHHSDHRPT